MLLMYRYIHNKQLSFVLIKFILLFLLSQITVASPTPIPLEGIPMPFPKVEKKAILPLDYTPTLISNIKQLDVDDGLSSSYVFDMAEDSLGNIWIATQTGGLDCYDGASIINYQFQDGNNAITNLIFDRNGHLWFQKQRNGLCRFDGHQFVYFPLINEQSNYPFTSTQQDEAGNLWFNSHITGSIHINIAEQTYHIINQKKGLLTNNVHQTIITPDGRTLICTSKGVQEYQKNGELGPNLLDLPALKEVQIIQTQIDQVGDYWLIGKGKLFHYNGDEIVSYTYKPYHNFTKLFIDSYNNIYLSINNRYLVTFKDGEFQQLANRAILKDMQVISFFEDSFHNLWLGSYGQGILKLDHQLFSHYSNQEGILGAEEPRPKMIGDSLIIIAADNTLNFYHEASNCFQPQVKFKSSSVQIIDLFKDSKNTIWYGTRNSGLIKEDGETITHFSQKKEKRSTYANYITEAPDGTIWHSNGFSGITKIVDDQLIHLNENDGILEDFYTYIFFDKKGQQWLGSYNNGLIKFENGTSHFISLNFLQKPHQISSIIEDDAGNLWIGSNLGLLLYHNNHVQLFTEKDGLPHNSILNVFIDKRQQLWVGTEKGIAKVFFNPETQDIKFSSYGIEEGFRGNDCASNAVVEDKEGNIWWGTGKMLTKYNPNNDFIQHHNPRIQLTDIELFFEQVDWKAIHQTQDSTNIKLSSISPWHFLPNDLQLPHKQNHLSFDFIATDWAAPQKLKYQFRLKGLDENWSPLTKESKAVYANIPPGIYTFQAKAINDSNLQSKTLTYSFKIHPPFWQTIWFRALVLLSFLASMITLIRWRTHALKKRQKELEEMVLLRTQEVEQSYNEVIKLNAEIFAQKQDIEQQQQQIQLIINNVPAGIAYVDKEQRIIFANKTLIDWFFQTDKHNFVNKHVSEVLHKELYQGEIDRIEQALEGTLITFERTINEGRTFFRGTYIPNFDKFKQATGFFVLLENISELKHTQEQLLYANHELQQFTSIASHDMKEPIRMISSFSSLLHRKYGNQLDEGGQEFIEFIQGAANRMSVLLDDLLDYARAGINTQQAETVNLNIVLQNVQRNLHLKIQETNTHIISDELPTVHAHFTTMNQVFQNLIANGIKFQPQRQKALSTLDNNKLALEVPQIQISYQANNTHYQFSIQDNGIGMASENQQKIFDVFKRLHSKTEYEGTGIGLATCKKIIEKYGGKIWVESEEGQGSCFHFTLPKN